MRNDKSPEEVGNEKKARSIIDQLTPIFVKRAHELGLKIDMVDHGGGEVILNFTDVETDTYCKHKIVLRAGHSRWAYRPTGDVTIKTSEPKQGSRWATKTICRNAMKGGKLNSKVIVEWIERLAAVKQGLAENKAERAAQEREADKERRASDAIQKREVGDPVEGTGVFREPDGSYVVRFTAEVGTFTAQEVKAILAVVSARKNS